MSRGGGEIVKGGAGFTLLEVLLAVTILGMAYLAIMQNFSVSLKNIERLERNGDKLFVAQLEMEEHFLARNIGEKVAGEIFAEGEKYIVMQLSDGESGKLATLSLKEL